MSEKDYKASVTSSLPISSIKIKNEAATSQSGIVQAEILPERQYKWNSNEDIYAILIATHRHAEWLSHEVRSCPSNGSMILYDRGKHGYNYRRDGYMWKKRKDGRHPREDHMKLRIKGAAEVLNGYYAHSAILSSFHRRSYSLPSRPNIILVHYLNAPAGDNADVPLPTLKHCDRRVWSREDLASQILPMYSVPSNTAMLPKGYSLPTEARLHQILDQLLTSQTNEDGVAVTAQWVLSLNNNCSYLVQTPHAANNTFQIPNTNVQFVLGTINAHNLMPAPTTVPHAKEEQTVMQQNSTQNHHPSTVPTTTLYSTSTNRNNITTSNSICDQTLSSQQQHQHEQTVNLSQGQGHLVSSHMTSSAASVSSNTSAGATLTHNVISSNSVNSTNHILNNNQQQMLLPSVMAAAHHSQHYNLPDNNNISAGATAAVAYNTSTATAQQKSPSTQHIFNAPQQRGLNMSTIQPSSTVTSSSQNNLESTVNNAFNTQPPVNLQNTVLLGLQPPPNQAGLMGNVSQMTHHSDGQQFVQHQNISGSAFPSHHILQDNLQKSQQFGENANTLQSQSVTAQPEFLSHQTVGGVTDHPLPMEISQNEQDTMHTISDSHSLEHLQPSTQLTADLEDLCAEMTDEEINSALSANMPAIDSSLNGNMVMNQSLPGNMESAMHASLSSAVPKECSPGNAGNLEDDLQLDKDFDLFAELNVNEDLEGTGVFNTACPVSSSAAGLRGEKVSLTALAPEWSYADGGCKVLLVGPWRTGTSDYTCMFGDIPVRAGLVQEGVLSCITPAHSQGVVQVTVAYAGEIISESSSFEFRDRVQSNHKSWFVCEESRLQMALVDRLEMIKLRLDILFPVPMLSDHMNLEQRVTALVHNIQHSKSRFMGRTSQPPQTVTDSSGYKGLTLLHLSAALGYRILLEALNSWRELSPSCEILNREVSTRSKDNNGCTAMHWACALGRMETTLVMYYMDRLCLDEINNDGMTPLSLARAFRNKHIVEMLVQQEHNVLESKLDLGLHTASRPGGLPSTPTTSRCGNAKLRRSASPARKVSPARHPPVTRHNSTPTSSYLPHQSCLSGEKSQPSPPMCTGEKIRLSYHTHSDEDEDSIVDIEGISDDESGSVIETDSEPHNYRIRTLAEHIIAAIPDRIKSTAGSEDSCSVALMSYRERSSSRSSYSSTPSCAEDSGVCTPLTSDWVDEWNRSRLSSSPCYSGVPSSHYYPPASPYYHPSPVIQSVAPVPVSAVPGSACSTASYHTARSESPPPSAQILGEYFNAGEGVEYGLSQLTLSDTEQRKLYQAAQVIQTAFRQFKDKKQQQKEIEAAVIIQTYYRRFKEFTTLRNIQKQQAATRIQSQFRSYYAQKRFKKSRDAALLIQHHYRAYKEHEHFKRSRNAAVLIQQKFRTHYNRKKSGKQHSQDGSSSMNGQRDNVMRAMHHYPPPQPHN